MSDIVTILTVVGEAVGATAHIAPVVGGAIGATTLCGLATAGWKIGRRFLWPGQVNCGHCLEEYADRPIGRSNPTLKWRDRDKRS